MPIFQSLQDAIRKEREEQAKKWAAKQQASQFRKWYDLPQPKRSMVALGGKTPGQVNSIGKLFEQHRLTTPSARPSNFGFRQIQQEQERQTPLQRLAKSFAPTPSVMDRQRTAFRSAMFGGLNPNEEAIQQGGSRARQFFNTFNTPERLSLASRFAEQSRTPQMAPPRVNGMPVAAPPSPLDELRRNMTLSQNQAQGTPSNWLPGAATNPLQALVQSGLRDTSGMRALGRVPVAGPALQDVAEGITSPLGLMTLPLAPVGATLRGLGGAVAAGTAANAFGAPPWARGLAELGGGIAPDAAMGIRNLLTRPRVTPLTQEVESGLPAFTRNTADLPPVAQNAERQVPDLARTTGRVAKPLPVEAPAVVEPAAEAPFGGHAVGAARFDPVARLQELIENAEPIRGETEALKSAERSRRAAAANAKVRELVDQGVPYRDAYAQARTELAGKYPSAQFTPPEPMLEPAEINGLFKMIDEKPGLLYFTRNNTTTALTKLLAGEIPQPAEIKLLRNVYGGELMQAILKHRKIGAWEHVASVLNAPRALQATADLSAPFRQGLMLVGRPSFWKSIPTMVRSFADEGVAVAVDDALRSGVAAKSGLSFDELMNKGNLYLAERGAASLSDHEEAFMSAFLNKIPGLNKITRGSERAYVTFLNKLRADTFKSIVNKWETAGVEYGDKDLADLGQWLNISTGRGPLPHDWAPMLNTIMFSPRLLTARLSTAPIAAKQMLTNPNMRMEVARDLASTIGFGIGVLGISKAGVEAWEKTTGQKAPVSIQLDPRSSDFGKVRFGKTRLDPWGGFQPIARYTAQIMTGQSVNITGVHKVDRIEAMKRFLQSKLAPVPGAVNDVISGQTFMGDELSAKPEFIGEQGWNRLAPFVLQDMVDAVQAHGAKGLVFAPAAVLGMGVQTYQTPTEKTKALFEKLYPDLGEYTGGEAQKAVINQDPRFEGIMEPTDSQEKLAMTQEEAVAPIRAIADEVRSGNSDAGANFTKAYSDYKSAMFWASEQEYQGVDFGKGKDSKYDKLVEQFRTVNLADYTDDDGTPDYGAYEAARDKILKQMPPVVQHAIVDKLRLPEDLQDIEKDFLVARDARDHLYDIPKIRGVTMPQYEQLQAVWSRAKEIRSDAYPRNMDVPVSIRKAAREMGLPNSLIGKAISQRSGVKTRKDNPAYTNYALDNYDTLNLFYPSLYGSENMKKLMLRRGIR